MTTFYPASIRVFLCFFLLLPSLHAEIFYSFFKGKEGSVARLEIDPATGKLTAPETLYSEEVSHRLETIRLAEDLQQVVVQNENSDEPHLLIGNIDAREFTRVQLSDRPRSTALFKELILASGHEGNVHLLSLGDKKVLMEQPISDQLKPAAMRPESVAFSPDGKSGMAVFLQDSTTGKSRGSRLAVFDIPTLALKHDLILPRMHGELDFDPGSKDRGPLPHTMFVHAESNTIAILCRLYGAIAVADLDAALNGEWKNFKYIPTGSGDKPGIGFPERGSIFEVDGTPYLFVSNASAEGGVVFLDLKTRKIAARVETGPRGLTAGAFLPGAKKLVAARTGFQWTRGAAELESNHTDLKDLLVFDVSGLPGGDGVRLEQITWGDYVYNIGTVPGTEQFVATAVRTEDNKMDFVTINLATKEPADRTSSIGVIRNFVSRPNR